MLSFSCSDCCGNTHGPQLIIVIYDAVSFLMANSRVPPVTTVLKHFNQPEPTVKAQAPPGSPPAKTEQFTSATSKRQLVFSNIVWRSSSFYYNVPTDSTNLLQPWYPLLRLYYNTVGALRVQRTGKEWLFGSSQDRLAFSQATVGLGSLPACHALCSLIKIVKYAELLKYMVFVVPFLPTTHHPNSLSQKCQHVKNHFDPLRPVVGFPAIILRNTV